MNEKDIEKIGRKKLWKEAYSMVRRGSIILLDKKTLAEVYKYMHEKTGMCIDDINVFIQEVISIAVGDIIAENVLDENFSKKVYGVRSDE
ncbi:MAG: hypothetical protein Q6363_005750 [Candidatus Njordarchaeota archaeon]